MFPDDTRFKIKNITEGIIIKGAADNCTAVRNILCTSYPTSTTVKKDFESKALVKEEQAILLAVHSTKIFYRWLICPVKKDICRRAARSIIKNSLHIDKNKILYL